MGIRVEGWEAALTGLGGGALLWEPCMPARQSRASEKCTHVCFVSNQQCWKTFCKLPDDNTKVGFYKLGCMSPMHGLLAPAMGYWLQPCNSHSHSFSLPTVLFKDLALMWVRGCCTLMMSHEHEKPHRSENATHAAARVSPVLRASI